MKVRPFLLVVGCLFVLAACAGERDSAQTDVQDDNSGPVEVSPNRVTDPEAALKDVAEEVGARVAAQDYGGYWDMWSAKSQAEVDRDTFVAFGEKCEPGGAPLTIEDVRLESDTEGVVRYEAMGFRQAVPYVLENNEWRVVISDETLTNAGSGSCPGG